MLTSNLCNYSDAYILFKGSVSVLNLIAAFETANSNNKAVIFKICAPFTDCINGINDTQTDNVKYIDVVMSMYNLIENSNK